jgi:hypothetical protein
MAVVERATRADAPDVERLLEALQSEEGMRVRRERIAWAVEQLLTNRFPGILLIAREARAAVGVASPRTSCRRSSAGSS